MRLRAGWFRWVATAVMGTAAFAVGVGLTPEVASSEVRSIAIGESPTSAESLANGVTTPSLFPATTSTTAAPVRLAERLSGWNNTLTWMTTDVDGVSSLHRLAPTSAEPESFELSEGSWGHQWNATAEMMAYLEDDALLLGPPNAAEPIVIPASSARWHQDEPLQIAWTVPLPPVGEPVWSLILGGVSESGAMSSQTKIALPAGVPRGYDSTTWSLDAWNEEGFVLSRTAWSSDTSSRGPRTDLVLLHRDGTPRRVLLGHDLMAVGHGVIAVRAPALGTVSGRRYLVSIDGAEVPIPSLPGTELSGVAPDGESWVAYGPGDSAAIVRVDQRLPLVRVVTDVAWSADGTFIAGLGPESDIIVFVVAGPNLAFEVGLQIVGSVSNLRIHDSAAGE